MDLMLRRRMLMAIAVARKILHTIASATGLVSFSTQLAEPVENLTVELKPQQDLFDGQKVPAPTIGKNLFNPDVTNYFYISASGVITPSDNSCYTPLIPVVAGSTYTYSGICGGSSSNNKRIHAYTGTTWKSQITNQTITSGNSFAITFTVPSGADGIRISAFMSDTDRQIELGSSATTYEPYQSIAPITGWTGVDVHHFALPDGYTAVDYVNIRNAISNIACGTLDNFNRTDIVVDCVWNSATYGQYKAIYSSPYSAEAYNITRLIYSNNATTYLVANKSKAGGGSSSIGNAFGNNVWHTIHSYYGGGTIDGTAYTSSTTQGTATTGKTMSLGHASCNISFRNFSVRNADTLFLQLIPCTNPSNVAGFYDTVGGVFYTVSGATASGTPGKISHEADTVTSVDFGHTPGTVYAGTLNMTTGLLTVTQDCIASYAGETLLGAWISDRDVYSSGTTPTIGAQVVYSLSTPTTYQLTPEAVNAVIGQNTLWHSANGAISLDYWDEQ